LQLNIEDPNFFENLIVNNEAHFDLSGFIKKQNSRLWKTENPKLM